MATQPTPVANTQTKSNNQGGLTSVTVTPPRKITYAFKATSSNNLSIPYAVAVDGRVLAAHASKPARVSGSGGTFTVTAQQGQRVSLYLNSDAHPQFRQQPVYAVIAGERDVVVTVTEKAGKHADADTPVKKVDADSKAEAAKTSETYVAPLTGDIWMRVSHKYTAAEVEARLPEGTSEAVKQAVKSIYAGLASATLTVTEPVRPGQSARTVTVAFTDSNNPRANITAYDLLADGLPRVHPGGYAALLTAALDNGIASLTVSSCWRPMLGSIAHRAGLGLDVSVVGGTKMNREELRRAFEGNSSSKQGNRNDGDNVTDAEVRAFGEYETAIVAQKHAEAEANTAAQSLAAANKAGDVGAVKMAEERLTKAKAARLDAISTQRDTRDAWNSARNAGEPAHARFFRTSLLQCACVRQLFDPWFMDDNARDSAAPTPNMQRGPEGSNERLHAHHLHITVDDPKIL